VEDKRKDTDRRLLIATFGPPGSGKSTICHALTQLLNVESMSPGLELRKMVASGGRIGREAEQLISTGASVPDTMLRSMLTNHGLGALVLDGVPQTVDQVHLLAEYAMDRAYDMVGVHLLLSESMSMRRIASRLSCKRCGQPTEDLQPNCMCGEPLVRRRDDELVSVFTARLRRYKTDVRSAAEEFARLFPYREFDATLSSKRLAERIVAWLRYLGYMKLSGLSRST